jgi:hypothetical protein
MHVFAVLSSVLAAGQVATAVPAGTGLTHPPAFEPVPFASHTQTQFAASRGPFTWLRDSLIERIWGIDKGKQSLNKPGPRPQPEKSWSRYGSDIVVRFEVHHADEVEALSEAIDILFLDVWDSTDEHVDIRLAKEVVSRDRPPAPCHSPTHTLYLLLGSVVARATSEVVSEITYHSYRRPSKGHLRITAFEPRL